MMPNRATTGVQMGGLAMLLVQCLGMPPQIVEMHAGVLLGM